MSFEEKTPLQIFSSYLETATFQSTYQPIFLKSILFLTGYLSSKPNINWGKDKDWITKKVNILEVKLDFIAVPFTKFYWDMFYKFSLKQSSATNRYYDRFAKKWMMRNEKRTDVNIYDYLKNPYLSEHGLEERPPSSLEEFAEEEKYDELRQKIIKKSFSEPLQALHKRGFYKREYKSSTIEPLKFDMKMISFMTENSVLLEYALNYKLTKYLESINDIPFIAEKILIDVPRKPLSTDDGINYAKEYGTKKEPKIIDCFYCKGKHCEDELPSSELAREHVIPFNFSPRQELHNSVPACVNCNSSKRDRLPNSDLFNRVLDRNKQFELKGYFKNYSEEEYKKLYKLCKETYHSGEFFSGKSESNESASM